ncbi:leucine-rich repeat flightless-interacting protein 2 isoform X4 [Oryzias melastigma]|uniref:leucine-rich repeat flightless-interacting protein 2 isoform X4 n=1 Tax=Oryzias melastigma TaxID=30732 RepID=UPI000CF802D4|nr:leucine-rich repeat flightless-interacting protein 2 isoform X4 [Oryzias melastigma]
MGTQGTGRKRSTKKERATAEDEALNLIAREAEARLAAKRAARAEAREIRMKELERQQKEIFQVQKKYYDLNPKADERRDSRWGDIEQWMEDSEKYSRSSRIQTLTDDDDRVSVGSRGSFRSELDSVGAFGGGSSSSQKKSKKKKKHKHKDRDRNGFEDDYSVVSGRSSRISDESRGSRSSRMDLTASDLYGLNGVSSSRISGFNGYQGSLYEESLCSASRRVASCSSRSIDYTGYRSSRTSSRASSACVSPVENCSSVASFLRSGSGLLDDVTIPDFSHAEEREFLEKGCRAPSSLTATTLTSLGGTSSRRGSGETALTVDADSSIREIKEIHELKDQIQDVETKYMQNLKEVKDSLVEVEEKYRKAMVSNAQLDNEKSNLMYEVDTLKDNLMELEELLSESRRQYEDKAKDYEREKHTHGVLQFHFNEMKESLKQSEELLNKHGIVLGPDLSINGDAGETEGDESADAAPRPALDSQGRSVEGNSILEIRLRKLVDEREKMIEQVKKLKAQLEQKTQKNSTDLSPDGEIVENGNDPNIMELQRDSSRQINDLKFKLVKAEQDVTALEQNVTRLEGHVTRYKSLAENAEKVEDELKAEKRKLQRELRSALDKIEELESSNSHLNKRLEKMKSSRGLAPTP